MSVQYTKKNADNDFKITGRRSIDRGLYNTMNKINQLEPTMTRDFKGSVFDFYTF